MYRYFITIFLIQIYAVASAQTSPDIQVELRSDQQVYIVGEEIWLEGIISSGKVSPKSIQVHLLDRKGYSKAEVRLLNNKGRFSGYLPIPAELVSDYYFLDTYFPGYGSSMDMQPLMVIHPKLPPVSCAFNPSPTQPVQSIPNTISVTTDKNLYAKRELVTLTTPGIASVSNISVTVQRYDQLARITDSILAGYKLSRNHSLSGEKETEGSIIHARVFSMPGANPAPGLRLFVGVMGDQAKIASGITDSEGRVELILPFIYGETQVVFSIEGNRSQQFRIDMEDDSIPNEPVNFPCLKLDEQLRPAIEERILSFRSKRGYYGDPLKKYILMDADTTDFYGRPDHQYMLDDYVRFPEMKDILLEFVPEIRVRTAENNQPVMQVLDEPYKTYFDSNALVLLDGIPVQDMKELLAFNPLLIRSIDIMSRKYYLGDKVFSGVVHYKSYKGDLSGFSLPASDIIYPYGGIQIPAAPIFPDHSKNLSSPLPDFSNLLYYGSQPSGSTKNPVHFYTSDAIDQYKIIVSGYESNGGRIYGEKIIHVE